MKRELLKTACATKCMRATTQVVVCCMWEEDTVQALDDIITRCYIVPSTW